MRAPSSRAPAHVVAVGAGNIGSHLVEHVGRMPEVGRVTLVDPGSYEEKNLPGQRVHRDDVGRAKVDVQARRLRRIHPGLAVDPIFDRVENVPLGRLRGDVIVAGLDSRRARQVVNEAAWRLGVPWIDAGVDAVGLLARVNVYRPGRELPCLECAWSEREYEGLEREQPCLLSGEAPPTNAPASLGALAASLQAIECEKLLGGQTGSLAGRQVLIDARHHTHTLTSFRRNPKCRLEDHEPWGIEHLELGLDEPTLGELAGEVPGGNGATLEVWGQRFVRALVCPACARRRPVLRVRVSLVPSETRCPNCDGTMVPGGFDLADRLDLGALSRRDRSRSLHDVGVRDGDVLLLDGVAPGPRYVEVAPAPVSENRRTP